MLYLGVAVDLDSALEFLRAVLQLGYYRIVVTVEAPFASIAVGGGHRIISRQESKTLLRDSSDIPPAIQDQLLELLPRCGGAQLFDP